MQILYSRRPTRLLEVEHSDTVSFTVAEVKARIQDKEGLDLEAQARWSRRCTRPARLIFHHWYMQDDRTLADYGVGSLDYLEFIPSSTGYRPSFCASDEICVKFPDGSKEYYMGFSRSSTISDLKNAIGPKRDTYTFACRFSASDHDILEEFLHRTCESRWSLKMNADKTQEFVSWKVYAVKVTQGLCDSAFFFLHDCTLPGLMNMEIKGNKNSYVLGIGAKIVIHDPHFKPGDGEKFHPDTARKEDALSFTVSDEQKARISFLDPYPNPCLTAIAFGSVRFRV
jgi:hypothetical protein